MSAIARLRKWIAFTVLVSVLTACQVNGPTSTAPMPTISPAPSAIPTKTPTIAPSSTNALSACDLELQSSAMRPGSIPDWNALGITTCYDLTFDLTSGGPDYSGSAVITFTNPGGASLNDLVLRLYPNAPLLFGGQLTLTSAQVNQAELTQETFLEDHTAVRLTLAQPVAAGETIQLQLNFTGSLPAGFASADIYGTFNFASDGPVLMMANAYPLLAPLQDGCLAR